MKRKKMINSILSLTLIFTLVFGGFTPPVPSKAATWQREMSLNIGKSNAGNFYTCYSTLLGNEIFILSDAGQDYYDERQSRRMDIYNIKTKSWRTGTPIPRYMDPVHKPTVVTYGDKIYAFGGNYSTSTTSYSTLYIYDTKTDKWTSGSNMPAYASEPTATVVGNKIFIIGGRFASPFGQSSKRVYIYDIATNTWSAGTQKPTGVSEAFAALKGKNIYVFGGSTATKSSSVLHEVNVVEIYNTETNTWSTGRTIPNTIRDLRGIVVGNSVYLMSGRTVLDTPRIYNLNTNSWSVGVNPPYDSNIHGTVLLENKIYVVYRYGHNDSLLGMIYIDSLQVDIPTTGIVMNPTNVTLKVGQKTPLTASIQPSYAANQTINWTSSNESVATVAANGIVTAVGKGTAKITATSVDGGYKAFCDVQVTVPVSAVSLNQTSGTVEVGKQTILSANVLPTNANNRNVTWVSSNPEVATVSANGTVTAISKGSAVITATTVDGNFKANCTLNTIIKATSVALDQTEKTLIVGEKTKLNASVIPAEASNQNVILSSDNESVATVSANGVVYAVSDGKANITVKTVDGGFEAQCSITVKPVNLVIGKSISSNSISGSNTPTKAIDGKEDTRWGAMSNTSDVDLTIDFDEDTTFNQICLKEYGDRINNYALQYHDGSQWVDIVTGTTIGENYVVNFEAITSSRVRLMMYSTKGVYGASIWEFLVQYSNAPIVDDGGDNGDDLTDIPDDGMDLALNAAVAASSVSGSNTAKKAVDGDSSTRWGAQNNTTNVTFDIDFGKQVTFDQVKINEYGSRIANYVIQYWDGTNWIEIQSGTTMGEEFVTEFDEVTTDKLRFLVVSTKGVYGASISDFEVYDVK